jgi:transposase InsO family protein
MADHELLAEIRQVLADSPFVGEGHCTVWARLRRRGVCTSRKRVLRLTREAGLLAPTARVRKRARRLHEGTITVARPDTLWATDATEGFTDRDGRCAVFCVIDHATGEAWVEASERIDRLAAADLLREVTTERFARWSGRWPRGSRFAMTAGPASEATTTRQRSTTSASTALSSRPCA